MMVIAEALGHALVVEPYVDTAVVATSPTARARRRCWRRSVRARRSWRWPAEAGSGDHWQDVTTTAQLDGDEWVLRGSEIVAMSARLATHLLVTARTLGGVSLFLVDAGAPGVVVHGYRTIDDRRAADLVFDGVRLPGDALLGDEGQAWPSIAHVRDEGAAAVCAEAVGCMRKCWPTPSITASDRMVDMHMEVEQAVAAVYLAVLNLSSEPAVRARAVSAAKASVGRAARFVGQNAVQLHGGMGMTEELSIGHYFKRLEAMQYEFGSTDYHVARYAGLTRG